MVLRWGRPLLRCLHGALPRLPRKTEPAKDGRWLAGLGSGRPPWWAAARDPRRSARLGHGGRLGSRSCAEHRHPHRRRTAARDRGGDGAQTERTDRSIRVRSDQAPVFAIMVTPGRPSKCASHVKRIAPRRRAVAKMMASAVASLWARQASAEASAISVSSGTI